MDAWEYKLIKLRGYFEEEKFYVRREKNGRAGFLVLAPFITSHTDVNIKAEGWNGRNGIIVNLGWVPAENKDDIGLGNDPTGLLVTKRI